MPAGNTAPHASTAVTAALSPADEHTLVVNDLVRVPSGRVGTIIGFYRGPERTQALVLFADGLRDVYPQGQLRPADAA